MTCEKVWCETDDRFGDSACFKVFKMGKVIWLQLLNQLTDFDQTWAAVTFLVRRILPPKIKAEVA